MSSIAKIKDLQDHLMKCLCKKVHIVSDFENISSEIFQSGSNVWITPYGGRRLDDKKYNSCGAVFRCAFVITAYYYCPTPVIGGVIDRGFDCETELCGPLIEADEFQCQIFECLGAFNCEKDKDFKGAFDTYTLKELFKPIFKDGCVLLRSLWERDIVVNY